MRVKSATTPSHLRPRREAPRQAAIGLLQLELRLLSLRYASSDLTLLHASILIAEESWAVTSMAYVRSASASLLHLRTRPADGPADRHAGTDHIL